MRQLSIFLLLSSIYKTIGKNICEPIDPVQSSPFDIDMQMQNQTTPFVDDKYKASKMVGFQSEAECLLVLDYLNMISEVSTVKKYIDLVFTHSPEFSINFYSKPESDQLGAAVGAEYAKITCTMKLRNVFEVPADLFRGHLRHECRHSALGTVHKILSNDPSNDSVNPFFPDTPSEKEKFTKLLAKGDDRMYKLAKFLVLEAQGKLDPKNQADLDQLRKLVRKEYNKYYKAKHEMTFPIEIPKNIRQLKKELRLEWGELHIKKMPSSLTHSIFEINFKDPLYAAVRIIQNRIDYVRKNNPAHNYLAERDAYLHGDVPQKILEYLYPEMENYTQNLIDKAVQVPSPPQTKKSPLFLTPLEHTKIDLFNTLKREEVGEDSAFKYAQIAFWALQQGELEEATHGFSTLIKKGYYQAEASLGLARIHYQQKSYAQAIVSFKYAQEKGVKFSQQDHEQYTIAQRKT